MTLSGTDVLLACARAELTCHHPLPGQGVPFHGPEVINGLPAHVLLVHVVVVLVPLTALSLVVSAVWPGMLRRLGLMLPLLAFVTLVSVPLTTHAGEWLERHDPLVRRHPELGDGMLPWALGLFVVSVALWWLGRRGADQAGAEAGSGGRVTATGVPVRVAAALVCAVVAVGSVVEVYRIGDFGAKAAWHDGFSAKPVSGDGHWHPCRCGLRSRRRAAGRLAVPRPRQRATPRARPRQQHGHASTGTRFTPGLSCGAFPRLIRRAPAGNRVRTPSRSAPGTR
ncbi:DUF2231 domain-containing protein, partial [Streptomyces sp. ICBB 8177]|uniref:DUF2231 domain-containing protein n=1 Tax=Streptomyces sp. ICBB 8177 TaxID=563922 RepID=UPI00316AC25B